MIQTKLFITRTTSAARSCIAALFCAAFALSGTLVNAQVSVTATAGTAGPTPYTTVNAAFTAINAGSHQGAITISVTGNTTEPSTPVPLLRSNAPSSYSSVLIIPSGGNWTINSAATPTATRGILELVGADNVTIDGDDPGTAGVRNLTILMATTTNLSTHCIRLASNSTSGADGADNNTVKNCNIVGGRSSATTTTSSFGILMSNSTAGTLGAYASLNTIIENNAITRCYVAIAAQGVSATYLNSGIIIRNNILGSATSADNIGQRGILINYSASTAGVGSANIQGNDIRAGDYSTSGFAASVAGIEAGTANAGLTIQRNNIHDVSQQNSSGYHAIGIFITGSTNNSGITIKNNFIRDMVSSLFATSITATGDTYGIYFSAGATNVNIDHNTIALRVNPTTGTNTNHFNACIAATVGGVTFASFRNNIIVNTQTSTNSFGVYSFATGNISAGSVDNNDYFVPNGKVGYYTANRTTLGDWQTATSKDAASININAPFVSTTDLHISLIAPSANSFDGAGANGTGVVVDYDGDARGTPPDIGADEFDLTACSSASGGSISPATGSICAGGTYAMSSTGASSGSGTTYQWMVSTTSGSGYANVSGGTGANSTSYTTAALTTSTYYYVLRTTCSAGALVGLSNELTLTVNPVPTVTASNNGPACVGGSVSFDGVPSAAGTYAWTGPNSFTSNLEDPTRSGLVLADAGIYSFMVTVAGCPSTLATTTVAVNVAPTITSTTATPNPICANGSSQLNVAASQPTAANQLAFSYTAGQTLDPMSGATTIVGSGVDDAPMALSGSTAGASIAIPFNFPFNGATYGFIAASPDGWLRLTTSAAAASSEFTNNVTSTSNTPKVYAYWDELATGTDGNVKYLVTGAAPNRIVKVQWFLTIPRNLSGPANSTFQTWLYEADGSIEHRYGNMGAGSMSASVGLTATAANYQSVTVSSNTVSTTVPNNTVAGQPLSGDMYRFANPTLTYSWSPATFLSATNVANPMATNVNAASTAYTVTVSNGTCPSTGNVTLNAATYTASASVVDNCPAQTFQVSVTVSGLAGGVTATINYTVDGVAQTPVAYAGPGTLLPAQSVLVPVTATLVTSAGCTTPLGTFRSACAVELNCEATAPLPFSHCYTTGDTRRWYFHTPTAGGTIDLKFTSGSVASGDQVVFWNGVPLASTQIGSFTGDMTNQTFVSTGQFLGVSISTDASGSCLENGAATTWNFGVRCSGCLEPAGQFVFGSEIGNDPDCNTGTWEANVYVENTGVDVNTGLPPATTSIEWSINGVAQTPITGLVDDTFVTLSSSIPLGANVIATLIHGGAGQSACNHLIANNLTVPYSTCPPANDACTAAATLPVGAFGSCPASSLTGSTLGADMTGAQPGCAAGAVQDIWYVMNTVGSAQPQMRVTDGSATVVGMQVFTACGAAIVPAVCIADVTALAQPFSFDQPEGTYYLRFFTSVAGAGTFTVCANTTPMLDMSATALVSPVVGACGTGIPVTVTVKNNTLFTINYATNNVTVTTNVTGAVTTTLSQVLTSGTLAPGATQDVTMTATLDMTTSGTYTFNANTAVVGDGVPSNNAMAPVNSSPLVGIVNVGTGQLYTTLTAAVAAYNVASLCSPVTFQLMDAAYPSETFPITISANATASATNTLTIRPASGQSPTISGALASGALIKLNGADFVTINGSNSGGTDRSLTITNTATTAPCAVWISSLGNGAGALNNTVKNCNINTSGATTATAYGIAVSGTTIASQGGDNDNVTLENNAINSRNVGIYANGNAAVSAGGMDNFTVTGNTFFSTGTVSPTYGLQVARALNAQISLNTINLNTSAATTPVGISIETSVSGSAIFRNRIESVVTSNTGGYGGRGITVGTGTSSSNISIRNNFVAGVNGSNFSGFTNSSSMGIVIGTVGNSSTLTTTTGGVNLHYNTVNMAGNYSYATACLTTALYIGTGASALDIRNNILMNSMNNTNGSGTASRNYAIYSAATNTAFTPVNYNDYAVSGAQGMLGFIGSNRANLAAIVTGFGGNANSVNVTPVFVSATDLHLVPASNNSLNDLGTPIAGITIDIDGDTRSAGTPDMGGDEFTPPVCTSAPIAGTSSGATTACAGEQKSYSNNAVNAVAGVTYNWFISTVGAGGPWTAGTGAGASTQNYTTTTLPAGNRYIVLSAKCTASGDSTLSNVITLAVNALPTPVITPASPVAYCVSGPLTSSIASGNLWSPGGATTQGITVMTSGNYSVTVTDGFGCAGTSPAVAVTISAQPTAVAITPAMPAAFCLGGNVPLTASGGTYTSNGSQIFGTQAAQNAASTTVTGFPAPFTLYYGGQRMQMMILASELSAAGFVPGSTFNGINFPVVSRGSNWPTPTSSLQNFMVKFGYTTASTLTAFQTLATTVRPAASFTPTVGYANNLAFSTAPAAWNGTDNVIIETTFSNAVTGTTNDLVTQYNSPAGFASCVVYKADGVAAATVAASTTVSHSYTSRPDYTLTGSVSQQASFTWSPATALNTTSGANVTSTPVASGTINYTVTATNGACSSNAAVSVTATTPPSGTFSYAGSPYCSTSGNAAVTTNALTAGGTYSSTGGLSINASTGAVNLGASTAASYTVTYTIAAAGGCPAYAPTASITITAAPSGTFSYAGSPYCNTSGTATVTTNALTAGGTYSASPVGLSINTTTGAVDLSASIAGNYAVTYFIAAAGGCPDLSPTASLVINTAPSGTFSYSGSPYCSSSISATVTTASLTSGGTYSATPAGLIINPTTGTVDLVASTAGAYTVNYFIAAGNGCSSFTTSSDITVNQATTWYADNDGDGFGDPNMSIMTCFQPGGYVANNSDSCPSVFGVVGSACNAGPSFVLGQLNASCMCIGVQCTTDLYLDITMPAFGNLPTWELREDATNILVQSGGGGSANQGINQVATCLPDGKFRLIMGGIPSGGAYVLRTNANPSKRIIDNISAAAGSTSVTPFTTTPAALSSNGAVQIPVGPAELLFTSCDKNAWLPGEYIVVNEDLQVAAAWVVNGANNIQPDNTGYDFWFYNPDGGYSYIRQRRHNVSDNFASVGSSRTCHMKVNNWASVNHIPSNVRLNVRVRAVVNNVPKNWGPACRFVRSETVAACPPTKLFDVPGAQFAQFYSCGVTRVFNSQSSNRIYARPVSGANKYKFTFSSGEGTFSRETTFYYMTLGWSGLPTLTLGATYDVTVQASFNNGATYCPVGDVCLVTIAPAAAGGSQNLAMDTNEEAVLNMWPNPNRGDQLYISLNAIQDGVNTVSLDIMDLSGKRMVARTIAAQGGFLYTVVDLNGDLAGGMYVVNVTAGDKVYTQRVVIQP